MSVIRKIPYIESVLASLNATQLGALKTAINKNADGTDANYSFLEGGTNIPALTEEITYRIECATIQLGRDKQRNGILIFTATYCVFLVYGESQKITIYNLNRSNRTYELVEEYCEIEELRRILDDVAEHSGDEWVETMKDKLVYDTETSRIECGTSYYVDGGIDVSGASTFDAPVTFEDTTQFNKAVTIGVTGSNLNLTVNGNVVCDTYRPKGNVMTLGMSGEKVIINGTLGTPISQDEFFENLHPDLTIRNFSAYKIGQFVYLELQVDGTNYPTEANPNIFTIKDGYRPKKLAQSNLQAAVNWGNISWCYSDGRFKNSSATTGASSTFAARFMYEIA